MRAGWRHRKVRVWPRTALVAAVVATLVLAAAILAVLHTWHTAAWETVYANSPPEVDLLFHSDGNLDRDLAVLRPAIWSLYEGVGGVRLTVCHDGQGSAARAIGDALGVETRDAVVTGARRDWARECGRDLSGRGLVLVLYQDTILSPAAGRWLAGVRSAAQVFSLEPAADKEGCEESWAVENIIERVPGGRAIAFEASEWRLFAMRAVSCAPPAGVTGPPYFARLVECFVADRRGGVLALRDGRCERPAASAAGAPLAAPVGGVPVAGWLLGQEIAPLLQPVERVAAALRAASESAGGRFAGLLFSNHGFLPFLYHWLCNARWASPGAAQRTVLVCTDADCLSEVRSHPLARELAAVVPVDMASGAARMAFGTEPYQSAMRRRGAVLAQVADLAVGTPWLLFETDLAFTGDVFWRLDREVARGGVDMLLYCDRPGRKSGVGGGFVLSLGGTAAPAAWFREVHERHTAPANVEKGLNDQHHMEDMVKRRWGGVRWRVLDCHEYSSGRWYMENEPGTPLPPDMALLQNNWLAGAAEKIERARRYGHWFLADDGRTCLGRPASLFGS